MIKRRESLEFLLHERDDLNKGAPITTKPEFDEEQLRKDRMPLLQADKSADLDDFLDMVNKIVTKALKKDKVEFIPDEGSRHVMDMTEKLEHPYIMFEVKDCIPKTELKPRVRKQILEEINDENNQNLERQGQVYGQRFEATVQFNILACDYVQAKKVMKEFEELIFNYTAYFKQNGVAELLFKRRYTDKNYDTFRQSASIRSLQYYVEIERNYVTYNADIIDITDIPVVPHNN